MDDRNGNSKNGRFKSLLALPGRLANGAQKLIKRYPKLTGVSFLTTLLIIGAVYEMRTSKVQAHLFHSAASDANIELKTGDAVSSAVAALSPNGPYDKRYGYTLSQEFASRLQERGYKLTARAEFEVPQMFGQELYPLYNEKDQAGLRISDGHGTNLSNLIFPAQAYGNAAEIPAIVLKSLLLVENRSLAEDHPETWNPSIEPLRMGFAALQQARKTVGLSSSRAGASTIPTQLVKMRHDEGGLTSSVKGKLRQMNMASVIAYADDMDTRDNIPKFIRAYVNSIPFTAHENFGEVIGFADGISIWFGTDFEEANRLLNIPEGNVGEDEFPLYATYYRQSLALIMALQRPTHYLQRDRGDLNERIDRFLPLMAEEGVISERLAKAALKTKLKFNDEGIDVRPPQAILDAKAAYTLKAKLLADFGLSSIYDLDRIDGHAVTTMNVAVTNRVSRYLKNLKDPNFLIKEGLTGFRRVKPHLAGDVTYSFTLYEKTDTGNVLRVQADTLDGEFNLNEDSKIELGSTAKLRTLVTYLDIIDNLHSKYSVQSPESLAGIRQNISDKDELSLWVIDYLSNPQRDTSLSGTLNAAMERRYSGDHRGGFKTNGGVLRFGNFDFSDYKHDFSVRETIHQSINLASVRLMEDIVLHIVYADMQTDPALLEDLNHSDRTHYLNRFVQYEGAMLLKQYKNQLRENTTKCPEQVLIENIQRRRSLTPDHFAVIYTTLYPDANETAFRNFIENLCANNNIELDEIPDYGALLRQYNSGRFDLNDRGYLTGLNPMQLWIYQRLAQNPNESWNATYKAAGHIINESYGWLLNVKPDNAEKAKRLLVKQNRRIWEMLEKDAFQIIHQSWKKQGFPFDTMVPSLASVLGSSADTPAASAELVGILLNGGQRIPMTSFSEIRLAENTPYEQHFLKNEMHAERVIAPEVAAIALRTIREVVEQKHGTARGAHGSVKLSDGRVLKIGGKTGTGDNEKRVRDPETGKLETVKKDRTAVFTFAIGEHHFGTITVAVLNEKANDHGFTSSMAVAVFRKIAPFLTEVIDPAYCISAEETFNERIRSEKAVKMGLTPTGKYRVKKGDNLSGIAAKFASVSANDISKANDNIETPQLVEGQYLEVPFEL